MSETKSAKNSASMPEGPAYKAAQIDALESLKDKFRFIVQAQRVLDAKQCKAADPTPITDQRIKLFSLWLGDAIDAVLKLESALASKHPGGKPPNRYRDLAFDLLTEKYIAMGVVIGAPALVRAVLAALPQGTLTSDANGREIFSQRLARSVIKDFRACLSSTVDDWN